MLRCFAFNAKQTQTIYWKSFGRTGVFFGARAGLMGKAARESKSIDAQETSND